jgi:hypothetical protein
VPPLPHDVVPGAAGQPAAVEGAESCTRFDDAPGTVEPAGQLRVGDRSEGAPPQVKFRVEIVARAKRTDLDASQDVTRASP